MKFNKNDIISLVVTILFHLLVILVLWLTVLKNNIQEEDSGVLVNFGNVDVGAGTFEPKYTGTTTPPIKRTPPPVPQPIVDVAKEKLITQNEEESVSLTKLAKKKKKEEQIKAKKIEKERLHKKALEEERIRKEKALAEMKRIAEKKRKEAISNQVAGAFGIGNKEIESQGSGTNEDGNQGSVFGNSNQGLNEGVGGYGSFNLNGRSISKGGLPKPLYTVQEEGRIVVNITVNSQGDVIFAEIGRGTNIDNTTMRKEAIKAAKKAKFNQISGTNNQSGTITYVYKLT